MAGAGYKLFSTGDVLTAAQVNTYLQQQVIMVFADSSARTTALSGVLAEGMFSYLTGTNAFQYYDGAAWADVSNPGDITGVTAGTGLSGGGTSGTVTVSIDTATTVDRTTAQTLTNKTLTAPIISSISNTGTLTLPTSTDTLVGRATTDTLTNKTLTTPVISSISNSGTITVPTGTDTLVGRATTDTLTNKTLTSPALTTPTISTATTNGDILYGTGSGALTRLGIGTAGQVLTVASGVPSWATPSASGFVGCLVAGNTQSIPNSTATAVLFAGTEVFDTNTFHSTATNTSRITIPSGKAGYYEFFYSGTWEDASSNSRQIKLYKNGTALSQVYVYQKDVGSGYFTQQFYTVLNAAVSDYFEVYVEQLSGGAKAIYGDSGAGSLPGLRFGCTFLGA